MPTPWPRPLVFTNGVFDILHAGHVRYLTEARRLGAFLLVAVNSDESARALGKGPGRPVTGQHDRLLVLRALRCVDAAVIFEEATPCALLEEVRPDVYCKGGDYDVDRLPEAALVQSWGGKAVRLSFHAGHSSTELMRRLQG